MASYEDSFKLAKYKKIIKEIPVPEGVYNTLKNLGNDQNKYLYDERFSSDNRYEYIIRSGSSYKFDLIGGNYLGSFNPPPYPTTNGWIERRIFIADDSIIIIVTEYGPQYTDADGWLRYEKSLITFYVYDFEYNLIGGPSQFDLIGLLNNNLRGRPEVRQADVFRVEKGNLPSAYTGDMTEEMYYFWCNDIDMMDKHGGGSTSCYVFFYRKGGVWFLDKVAWEAGSYDPYPGYPSGSSFADEVYTPENSFFFNSIAEKWSDSANGYEIHFSSNYEQIEDMLYPYHLAGNHPVRVYDTTVYDYGYLPYEYTLNAQPVYDSWDFYSNAIPNDYHSVKWPYKTYSDKKSRFLYTVWYRSDFRPVGTSEVIYNRFVLIGKETDSWRKVDGNTEITSTEIDFLAVNFSTDIPADMLWVAGCWILNGYAYILCVNGPSHVDSNRRVPAKIYKVDINSGLVVTTSSSFTLYTGPYSKPIIYDMLCNDVNVTADKSICYGSGECVFFAFKPDTLEVVLNLGESPQWYKNIENTSNTNMLYDVDRNFWVPCLINDIYKLRSITTSANSYNTNKSMFLTELYVETNTVNIKVYDIHNKLIENAIIQGHDNISNRNFDGIGSFPYDYITTSCELQLNISAPFYESKIVTQSIVPSIKEIIITLAAAPNTLHIKIIDELTLAPVGSPTINGLDKTNSINFTGDTFNYTEEFTLSISAGAPGYINGTKEALIPVGTTEVEMSLANGLTLHFNVKDQFGNPVNNAIINGTDLVYGGTWVGNTYGYKGNTYLQLDVKAAGYENYLQEIEFASGMTEYTIVMTAIQYTLNILVVDEVEVAVPGPVINGTNITKGEIFNTISYNYYGAWSMDLNVTAAGFKGIQVSANIDPGTTQYKVIMKKLYQLNIIVKNKIGQLIASPFISGINMTTNEYIFNSIYEYSDDFLLDITVTAEGYKDFATTELITKGTLEYIVVMDVDSTLTAPYLIEYEFVASEGIILMSVGGTSFGKVHFRVQVYKDEALTQLIKEVSSESLSGQFRYFTNGAFSPFPPVGIMVNGDAQISVQFDAGPRDKFYVVLGSYELEATL